MKPRTLLVLLALVVGLGAFVWFYEREQPGSEEREKLAKRVLGVEREDVVRLELHAGDRITELVRTHKGDDKGDSDEAAEDAAAGAPRGAADDQDRWRLRRPIDFPADYWQVDALVRTLAELDSVRELDQYDAKEVGLDSPRGRVVVELEDGKKKELRIGSEVPGLGQPHRRGRGRARRVGSRRLAVGEPREGCRRVARPGPVRARARGHRGDDARARRRRCREHRLA